MGKALVEKMLPVLKATKWPEIPEPTLQGRQAYLVGLDKVDDYTDNPKALTAALRTFQSGESRPYALAGVAYTLISASRERDGSYALGGLKASLEWLEKAQELAPDLIEINFIEAFIYIYSGRLEDARIVLDYLESLDDSDYYVLTAEASYWRRLKNLEETVQWLDLAIAEAATVPRKLRLRSTLGDCYLEFGLNDKALEVYKEAVHFAKENPSLWHRMSIAYWRLENYDEAARCNTKALSLREDFPEALKMRAALDERQESRGFTDRLLGR